ncbi:MAG: ATP-binding protein, partial [Acidobacteriota bacterium]
HLFRSFGIDAGRIALRCRLVEVEIDLDRAVACGLIVNELISNSLEHAFVDGASGQVGLELGAEDGGRARLVVWDDGVGFELDVDRPHSMGLELVAMMVEQLGGRLEAGGADEAEDAGRRGSRFTVEWSEAASSERGDR